MATSKFERRFTTNTGEPLLGATVELVPQANEYPEGKIVLIEHPTRKGWYYKDGVPIGEYKIYINGTLYTQNIFHSENILYYIVGLFNDQLIFLGQLEPSRIKIPLAPPSVNKKGNIYFEESSRTLKIDIDGTGNYVPIGGGGGSSTSGVVLISGNQTITGRKTFYVIDFNQNQPGIGFVLPLISPQYMSGSKTGAMFYDVQNNVLKISKDDTGNNFLTLGSSEGENWISLHGLSVHDGQINGLGIYIFRNGQVFSLPLRNSQNGYYAEDVPGAIYIDEINKRLLINFGQSHYGEDGAVNDEYFEVLPKDKMLEAVRQDSKIINGDAGQFRDYDGILTIHGRFTFLQGIIQIPNKQDSPDVLNWWNSIYSDAWHVDSNNQYQYRLNVRFKNRDNPTQLITKSFPEENEIKSWIESGVGQFTGTATQCIVTVQGATVNDRYFVTPIGTSWNANDMLIVSPGNGEFTVTRGSGGTNNLQFYWFRRKAGT